MTERSRHILVVDDDVDIAAGMDDILTDLGYRVDQAHDGSSALARVQEKKYDVVLLDYKMPDMDGATLYKKITQLQPEVRAIMITAYAGSDGVERALAAGTWQVLRKPVDITRLLALIDEAIDHPLVLVVDDDQDFCSSIRDVLEDRLYRVGTAHDIKSASAAIDARRYDALVVDLRLGNELSIELLEKFGRLERAVIVTGFRGEYDQEIDSLLGRGVSFAYDKPIVIGELLEKLRRLAKIR